MKKILFVFHTSTICGGSFCLLNILRALDRRQFCPLVVLQGYGPLVDEIKKLGIEVYYVDKLRIVPYNTSLLIPSNLLSIYHIVCSFGPFKKLLLKIKPDIVYINSMMIYPYLRIVKSAGFKSVIHIREHWPEGQHRFQRRMALSHISKNADKVIAINKYSASMLAGYGREVPIVYDWVDMKNRFDGTRLCDIFGEDTSSKKVLLYIGAMQKVKGALEVVSVFHNDLNNEDYRLLIMGINSSYHSVGLMRYIKNFLRKFGIKTYSQKVLDIINSDKRIKCIDGKYLIGDILKQTYCVVSYFTIPHANLGLAESIICRTLSVAAKNDEASEYSLDGELAILYKENDIDSFRSSLCGIEEARAAVVDRINEKAYIVESMFDPSRNIGILHKVLLEIS